MALRYLHRLKLALALLVLVVLVGVAAAWALRQPECPSFTNSSHPAFVCPPSVLARRRPLPGNHSAEYERLGGINAFHSQFWEDWFLYAEFFHAPRYRDPLRTFVEVGAYDGVSGSNSHFYEHRLQWRGVLIEASTANYVALEQRRRSRRVAPIHGAVCTQPRLLTLWGGGSLTTNNRADANGLFHGENESFSPCLPMRLYLEMARERLGRPVERIDYFSIDVEGQELELIEAHDWRAYPVDVVSIEMAVQPLLSGTAEYQHAKRCALWQRGLCRWPFYDGFVPPTGPLDPRETHFSQNNEIWIRPEMLE